MSDQPEPGVVADLIELDKPGRWGLGPVRESVRLTGGFICRLSTGELDEWQTYSHTNLEYRRFFELTSAREAAFAAVGAGKLEPAAYVQADSARFAAEIALYHAARSWYLSLMDRERMRMDRERMRLAAVKAAEPE